eukprot:11897310-Ditylum_brightwellii.AAC.1
MKIMLFHHHKLKRKNLLNGKINCNCVHSGVLKEQHRQQMLGIHDPEEIRNVSFISSQWARNVALKQGAVDVINKAMM